MVNRISSRARFLALRAAVSTIKLPLSSSSAWSYFPAAPNGRFFSSAEPPKQVPSSDSGVEDEDENAQPTTLRGRVLKVVLSPQNQFYAMVAGGGVAAYLLSRVVLGFTSFFTHLTPTVVAKWSFYTGFGTATVLGGVVLLILDNLTIRADPVYRYCLNWVTHDSNVQRVLGDGLTPGHLRSYRLDAGRIGFTTTTTNPLTWRPPRVQMLFDVTATGPPYRTGLVTLEAVKSVGVPARLHTTLLKVDYETGQDGDADEGDETLFLRGSPEELERTSQRSGMSLAKLARAVHINAACRKEGK